MACKNSTNVRLHKVTASSSLIPSLEDLMNNKLPPVPQMCLYFLMFHRNVAVNQNLGQTFTGNSFSTRNDRITTLCRVSAQFWNFNLQIKIPSILYLDFTSLLFNQTVLFLRCV